MTKLTEASLDFAKNHIEKYYDSDFFPKAKEFDALWHCWSEVKEFLKGVNIGKMYVTYPRVMASPKPTGDYRVVHQLEPVDAVIYTALAYLIAEPVEAARQPESKKIACSYRFEINEGNFFGSGTGYGDFIAQTEYLASEYKYILVTDITDFYNQIYLHKLNHAIEHADESLKNLADDIEGFVSRINDKASQGVPVGPTGSIVMAEAVLVDVDNFLLNLGVRHTRYVDDFRIFSDNCEELKDALQKLTVYLYSVHRLTLASGKTGISDAEEYVEKSLHNPYAQEKSTLLKSIEIFNPYAEESVEEFDFEFDTEEEELEARLVDMLETAVKRKRLDLGLARSAIRRARRHNFQELVPICLDNFSFLAPVISDVILYFVEVLTEDDVEKFEQKIIALIDSDAVSDQLVRFWLEWFLASLKRLAMRDDIKAFVESGSYVNRAKLAATRKDLSWVRAERSKFPSLGSWERRALLYAARILPSDEKKNWLKMVEGSSPVQIDKWVAKWVREGG